MDGTIDFLGYDLRLCLFAAVTGTACPGCGLTRAVLALVAGNFTDSWRYHPLAIPLLGQAAALGWVWLRRARVQGTAGPDRVHGATVTALGLILLIVWLLRWSTGTLPPV